MKPTENSSLNEQAAECLLALGKGEEATPYFARAWELLAADAWMRSHEAERLKRLKMLGRL